MLSASDNCIFCHQMKILIGFLCEWELNSKFLIQPSETLLVELTTIHFSTTYIKKYVTKCIKIIEV